MSGECDDGTPLSLKFSAKQPIHEKPKPVKKIKIKPEPIDDIISIDPIEHDINNETTTE